MLHRFKPPVVVLPGFFSQPTRGRESKAANYVVEIIGKGRPQQAPHILPAERQRLELCYSANGLREHIAFICQPLMLATDREGLAGRTAKDGCDAVVSELAEVD
jgi:hypothetical protein